MIKLMRRWTFLILLTVLTASCSGSPKFPEISIWQTIYNQKFCDANGQSCEVKSVCREYYFDSGSRTFIYLKDHPLQNSNCHGAFGLSGDDVVAVKDWSRKIELHINDLQTKLNSCEAARDN